MNDLPGVLEQLIARIESLERRIAALEGHPSPSVSAAPLNPAIDQPAAATPPAPAAPLESVSVFSVLGRAMLGIAAAYLLRAVAQSHLLPAPAAAAMAVPYAIAWLVFAVRTRAGAWFAAAIYSATSALILAPMLWELVFHFQILSAAAAAAVIAVYISTATALALAPASPHNLEPVLWVANIAAVLIALSLFFAARSTTPFLTLLLFLLVLAAIAESRNHVSGLRALNALAASAAIWAAIYVYISPAGTRPDYPSVSSAALIIPALVLFAVELASIVHSTIARRQRIAVFEVLFTVISFLLAAIALDAFVPAGLVYFGLFCLTLGGAGYAAVYLFFDRAPAPRNYRVFSTWSAVLVLAGIAISLPAAFHAPAYSLAAVAATALGARFSRLVLVFHGAVCLAAAAAASSLATYTIYALAGSLPGAPSWSLYVAFVAAIACYALLPRWASPSWREQTLQIFIAALVISAAAALLVHALAGLLALRIPPGPHHLAFFRTLSLCAAALALAWAAARFQRRELARIANAALALLAVKLVAEDLRQGRLAYIAASIFLFALTLIAVPRVRRLTRKSRAAAAPPAPIS